MEGEEEVSGGGVNADGAEDVGGANSVSGGANTVEEEETCSGSLPETYPPALFV